MSLVYAIYWNNGNVGYSDQQSGFAEESFMKTIITIQHTQSVHHTNGMVGSWTDWELSDLGVQQANRIGEKLKA